MRKQTRFYDVELLQRFIYDGRVYVKTSQDHAVDRGGKPCIFALKASVYPYDSPITIKPGYKEALKQE